MNVLDLIEQSAQSLIVLVAIATSLGVWAMKSTGSVPKKWLPVASLLLGAIVGGIFGLAFGEPINGAIDGFIAGGFASGGYDAIKSVLTGKDDK